MSDRPSGAPVPPMTPERQEVEVVVGVLPPGRYQLRKRPDGQVEVVRLEDRRRPPEHGRPFWSGLEPFDQKDSR